MVIALAAGLPAPDPQRPRRPEGLFRDERHDLVLGQGQARTLAEGDEVAGFEVLHTPGHAAGHIALWREADRVLIAGDVLNTQHPLLGFAQGLCEPLAAFSPDPEENRRSLRRLGELEPRIVAVGHGRPWTDTERFVAFCRSV